MGSGGALENGRMLKWSEEKVCPFSFAAKYLRRIGTSKPPKV